MATWEDVRRLALALPETDEHASYGGAPSWRVKGKAFVWDRPLRVKEAAELGESQPAGPVLGAAVADEGVKTALIAEEPQVFFTVSHFDGYPAVLLRLDQIDPRELEEVVTDAWVAKAPKRLAQAFLAEPS
jgi:hypothetical protein